MEIFNTKADSICVAEKANTGDVDLGSSSWHASLVVLSQMPSCEHTNAADSGRIDLQIADIYDEHVLFSAERLAVCIDPKVAMGWLETINANFHLRV